MKSVFAVLFFASISYGQVCRGSGDDTVALQAMLDNGGIVVLPDGICMVSGLVVSVDGTEVRGRGRTVLRRIQGTYLPHISMPAKWGQHQGKTVKDVAIKGVMLDGGRVGISPAGQASHFGIQIIAGENITLENLDVFDQAYDGISACCGNTPIRNLTVKNVRTVRCERNGLHLGFVDGAKVTGLVTEDCPSQFWRAASYSGAGNGLDIEVEGIGSYVNDVLVERFSISRPHIYAAGTAGCGVAMQPAFGPITNVTLRNGEIINHQIGVQAFIGNAPMGFIDGITVEGVSFWDDQLWADGYVFQFIGVQNVTWRNNNVRVYQGPASRPFVADIRRVTNLLADKNQLFSGERTSCIFSVQDSSGVSLISNRYNGACFSQETNSSVTKYSNVSVP